jgi:uncharacterized protein YabE (DUF348 family)
LDVNPQPGPDDTQPTETLKPISPVAPVRPSLKGVMLLAGVLLLGVVVLGVLSVFVLSLLPPAEPPAPEQYPVSVWVNGDMQEHLSRSQSVQAFLQEAGIPFQADDAITPPLDHSITAETQIRIESARTVLLTLDGQLQQFRTHLTHPVDILASAGISLDADDVILVDGTETQLEALAEWPVPVQQIEVYQAMTLLVMDGEIPHTLRTTSATVGDALFEAGITLYLADSITPDLNTPITPEMQVLITRGAPVTIIADGDVFETRIQGETVADALANAGVALVGLDYSIPAEDAPLLSGIRIRVIRVREELLHEEASFPYETIYQADANLELDQRSVLQAGQNGMTRTTIRVRYENDVEISREVEETITVQPTVNQIIGYGTNIVIRVVDTPEGPREYWRKLRMYATSYHPAALGGSNITAIGEVVRRGIVGSDPTVIPYRTQLFVPGYGLGMMADTGALRRRLRIDLGYSDEDWVSWSRYVDVYLLTPIPEIDKIDFLLPLDEQGPAGAR